MDLCWCHWDCERVDGLQRSESSSRHTTQEAGLYHINKTLYWDRLCCCVLHMCLKYIGKLLIKTILDCFILNYLLVGLVRMLFQVFAFCRKTHELSYECESIVFSHYSHLREELGPNAQCPLSMLHICSIHKQYCSQQKWGVGSSFCRSVSSISSCSNLISPTCSGLM